jgi:hypothetical protein
MESVQHESKWSSITLVSRGPEKKYFCYPKIILVGTFCYFRIGCVEYVIVATHREMWQNIGPILASQADLASFSLEVSKKLDLRYNQPPKPVHLTFESPESRFTNSDNMFTSVGQSELQSVADLFKKES